jgi:hypothetical protein
LKEKNSHFHFFAPYHGHSVCDGHFGKGKQELRSTIADGVLISEEEVIHSFDSLKHTLPGIYFDSEPEESTPCQKFAEGSRKFYHFFVENVGEIFCRESCDSNWIVQQSNIVSTQILLFNRPERYKRPDDNDDIYGSDETTETFIDDNSSESDDNNDAGDDKTNDIFEDEQIQDDLKYDSHTGSAKNAFIPIVFESTNQKRTTRSQTQNSSSFHTS